MGGVTGPSYYITKGVVIIKHRNKTLANEHAEESASAPVIAAICWYSE